MMWSTTAVVVENGRPGVPGFRIEGRHDEVEWIPDQVLNDGGGPCVRGCTGSRLRRRQISPGDFGYYLQLRNDIVHDLVVLHA